MARISLNRRFWVVFGVVCLLSTLPAEGAARAADRRNEISQFGIVEQALARLLAWVGRALTGKEGMLIDPFGVQGGGPSGVDGFAPSGEEVVGDPNG